MKAGFVIAMTCAVLALSACSKKEEDTSIDPAANESSARDAAPGPLSETEPPSTPASDPK